MTRYFDAFDITYAKGFLIGEMIWNFADFATKQGPFLKSHYPDVKKRTCTLLFV